MAASNLLWAPSTCGSKLASNLATCRHLQVAGEWQFSALTLRP